jgi:hypothetical protein
VKKLADTTDVLMAVLMVVMMASSRVAMKGGMMAGRMEPLWVVE